MSVPERAPPSGLPANITVISIHPMYGTDQVCFATFLGGPVGGGWLMALNYKRLGEPAKSHLATGLSVLAMVALVAIGLASSRPPRPARSWWRQPAAPAPPSCRGCRRAGHVGAVPGRR